MRTKTLLIAAAVLAVGVASSLAQTYSQNLVGYVNMTIGAGKYQIVGNTLVNGSDVGQTNNDINACLGAGFVSDPAGPPSGANSVYIAWGGAGYSAPLYYFNAADATTWETFASPAGWYDDLGNYAAATLPQGKSAFVKNASGAPMTVTITGNVLQGTNTAITIATGYALYSLQQPISTNASVAGYGLPQGLTSDPAGPPSGLNDVLIGWGGTAFSVPLYWFNANDATTWETFASPAGWYDDLGNLAPAAAAVNQGFFILHHGAGVVWTNKFTVQ
jgi:hypothetical protein